MSDNSKVKFTIDGREVEVQKGQTILEGARKLGIDIPVFCYHPRLVPVGACRMCYVEVEKIPKLVVSCATPATEGMVVRTNTEKVIRGRVRVLEFLLTNHPLDCPTCDKGGECDLQNLTFAHGPMTTRYSEDRVRWIVDTRMNYDDLKLGPLVYRNQNRCILCYRCVRLVREVAGYSDLGAFGRGAHTRISTPPAVPFDDEFSGNTVEYCPVGALLARNFRYKVRPWLLEKTPVVCPLCGDGCNMTAWTNERMGHVRNTTRANPEIDEGIICDRGRFGATWSGHEKRIKSPGIQGHEVRWEEALTRAADRINEIRSQHGSDALAVLANDTLSNEDAYIISRFTRQVLGTNNVDFRVASRSQPPGLVYKAIDELSAYHARIAEFENFKTVVIFGCNISAENPVSAVRLKKGIFRNGTRVIHVGSKKLDFGIYATTSFTTRPGCEIAAMDAVARKAGDRDGADYAAAAIGLAEEDMGQIVSAVTDTDSVLLIIGENVWHRADGEQAVKAAKNLLAAVGANESGNKKIHFLWSSANARGAVANGLVPDLLPGYVAQGKEQEAEKTRELFGEDIPRAPGADFTGILKKMASGEIKCVVSFGSDPVADFPDRKLAEKAVEACDFVVAVESLPNDMTEKADVVLPCALFPEFDGTFVNTEGRVQLSRKALDPPRNILPIGRIVSRLAGKLGRSISYEGPEALFAEWSKLHPSLEGRSFPDLGDKGLPIATQAPKTPLAQEDIKADLPEEAPAEFPFALMIGDLVYHFRHLTGYAEDMRLVAPQAELHINPEDAKKVGVEKGQEVKVVSQKGEMRLPVVVDPTVSRGTVFVPRNYHDRPVNALMDCDRGIDYVRIERV